jgi:hypothetical protein
VEAKKLLSQYAKLRRAIIQENNLLRVAGQYSIYQERLITDVRQFTTLNLMPVLDILQRINAEAEKE